MNANDVLHAMYDGQVLVFGHRGAKAYAPMNTMPAFELALAQGAHGIELDVHRSADGHPVILHDFTVNATSDSAGMVTQMTLAQLKALDAGAWFDSRFAGTRIPTLDEVFEAVGSRLYINIEIKSMSLETDGVEQVVADCIARHNMARRVIVSSFNPFTLMRFRALMTDVPLGFLEEASFGGGVTELIGDLTYEAYHPHHTVVNADMVMAQTTRGRIINTWTVNDPARAQALRDLGVRGIITDVPDVILAALAT